MSRTITADASKVSVAEFLDALFPLTPEQKRAKLRQQAIWQAQRDGDHETVARLRREALLEAFNNVRAMAGMEPLEGLRSGELGLTETVADPFEGRFAA